MNAARRSPSQLDQVSSDWDLARIMHGVVRYVRVLYTCMYDECLQHTRSSTQRVCSQLHADVMCTYTV